MDADLDAAILESLPLAVFVVRDDGTIVRANARAGAIAGRDAVALAGEAVASALARLHCGTPIPDAIREVAAAGRPAARALEADWIEPGSRLVRPMRIRIAPVELDGRRLAVVAIEALDDAEVPSSLDDVLRRVGEIRHEMNNLLMGLLGTAELVLDRKDLPADVRARVTSCLGEAKRLRDRVADLGTLRRPG